VQPVTILDSIQLLLPIEQRDVFEDVFWMEEVGKAGTASLPENMCG
jgi:hypothetical protein